MADEHSGDFNSYTGETFGQATSPIAGICNDKQYYLLEKCTITFKLHLKIQSHFEVMVLEYMRPASPTLKAIKLDLS